MKIYARNKEELLLGFNTICDKYKYEKDIPNRYKQFSTLQLKKIIFCCIEEYVLRKERVKKNNIFDK
jgi:hypothetical protein